MFLDELVARRSATGAAALYATHDAEEALGLADRVALLNGGRLVQVGTPQEVYDRPVDEWAARLTGPTSVLDLPDEGQVLVRPGWARLGGDRSGLIEAVRFSGPHSDYQLSTDLGRLLVRQPGPPQEDVGAKVTWSLDRHLAVQPSSAAVRLDAVDDRQVTIGVGLERAGLVLGDPVADPLPVQGDPVADHRRGGQPDTVDRADRGLDLDRSVVQPPAVPGQRAELDAHLVTDTPSTRPQRIRQRSSTVRACAARRSSPSRPTHG